MALMLKIRLQRVGRKHEPTFRVVLTDSKNSAKSGRFHEILGFYDPRKKNEEIKGERVTEWMKKGAQVSDTVYNLLITHKIIEGKKKNVLPRKAPYKTEAKLAEEKAAADKAEAARLEEEKAKEEAAAAAEAEKAAPVEEAPEASQQEEASQEVPPKDEPAPEVSSGEPATETEASN
jgi:small subunit ribosomal protein S16